MNISEEVVKLLNDSEKFEMNLYRIAQQLDRNPGSIRRVLNSLLKSNDVQEIFLCPHCGSDIQNKDIEKRYSIKIVMGQG